MHLILLILCKILTSLLIKFTQLAVWYCMPHGQHIETGPISNVVTIHKRCSFVLNHQEYRCGLLQISYNAIVICCFARKFKT